MRTSAPASFSPALPPSAFPLLNETTMRADILTIGDELLIGQIINANQAFVAERLNEIGIAVGRMLTIGDDHGGIVSAFPRDGNRDGSSSPPVDSARDDITKKAACDYFRCGLVPDPAVRANIASLPTPGNPVVVSPRRAGARPGTSIRDQNPLGTAPGLHFHDGRSEASSLLPGVPRVKCGRSCWEGSSARPLSAGAEGDPAQDAPDHRDPRERQVLSIPFVVVCLTLAMRSG
ncbi:MAG: molybdopterin-binding protein, partial [Ignavibacteriales bacterium]|nr:molybdopterin-binding protein [Ignavibacteriales bacterium]